jgi:ketosteroid isomerase-like protein
MKRRELDDFVDEYHRALDHFFRGDPKPMMSLYSHRDDASLANPFGPVAVGWEQVADTMERAAGHYRDGRASGFETLASYSTPELAYVVEVERFKAKVGDAETMASGELRVTSVLRREDEAWKVVHRHADPITAPRPPASIIQG